MRLVPQDTRTIRKFLAAGGLALAAFGVFSLSAAPRAIILRYFSHDAILNPETIAGLTLIGWFSIVFGSGAAAIAIFRPGAIERAAALPRTEFLYFVSVFGTNLTIFLGLALGIQKMSAYVITLAIVVIGALLFLLESKISPRISTVYAVVFSRWAAFAGYLAAGTFFFALRFPFSTWNRYLFSRDFPMFQYTALLDLGILKQGALYGWESNFSCGYPAFLNLRSILIPYLPFSFLPPPVAFHAMLFVTYVSAPYLVYWVARQISGDRDMAILSGWAAVGAMATYMWHILLWGMAPTFESVPFLLLALGFFIRALKGSRWGVFLSALFWTPVAYIHFGHFAHVGLVLAVIMLVFALEERRLRPAFVLAKVSVLAAVLAAPYLALFYHYRSHIILTNMFSYPDESFVGMAGAFLLTVSHFIPTLIWDWRGNFAARAFPDYGYFSLATVFSLCVVYLFASRSREKRAAVSLYAGAIIISALSFVPKFELSFQRMLYMVPPLMALALGFWLGEARKRGLVTPFYVLLVVLVFYTRPFWLPDRIVPDIPTLAHRADFEPAVAERVKALPGNYVLYEDTASLTPYVDLNKEAQKIPDALDVHSESFLHLETGKRLFSHPGYNPHPYYDLRWTYIATGTYLGKDLTEYPPEVFKALFRKWGVEYLVLWSDAARTYFGNDPAYSKILDGRQYTIYRFEGADPRAVVTESGSGDVSYPDNFSALVTLKGVTSGSQVILRANYFPEWRASCSGADVPLSNLDGQVAFAAPASDCTVRLEFPRNRGWFFVPLIGLATGVFLSLRRLL
jgi:hypothetical protein